MSSYTGRKGEANFEADFVDLLTHAGWERDILKNKTVKELEDNWRSIIFERNRSVLNDIPLTDSEMDRVMDLVAMQANTPVKANHFINGRPIAIKRDSDSLDSVNAGKEVYLELFSPSEIAGGSSRYQIAEHVQFSTDPLYSDRVGDVTLLINGMPVIHIELKTSGVDIEEATGQIKKYAHEDIWKGFMGLVQVFWAITPEDALYFANPGDARRFNPAFYFRWGNRDNEKISDWRELITGESHILSIPEAHKLIGYYTVADSAKDVLRVFRSYQYDAVQAIVSRASKQVWGNHDQLGGFVWCTTGGGKTLTSFKAGQLITDLNFADKVLFVVDRVVLGEQSTSEYNSFQRAGESVYETVSSDDLFDKLKSNKSTDRLLVTSIQKLQRINDDMEKLRKEDLNIIQSKRLVLIIDEAHRSQFGTMHQVVKRTFYNALFFGFTGTPIFSQNMKEGELTTQAVFGKCLSVYTLATGIRDKNVLGFWPEAVKTYNDEDLKEAVALAECHATRREDITRGSDNYALFKKIMERTPMASELDEFGKIKRNAKGEYQKGIEDYLPTRQYDDEGHRNTVVNHILSNFNIIAFGEYGTRFHAILATSSIPEAYEYWKLFKEKGPELHVTALFDPNTNGNSDFSVIKDEAIKNIVDDYNTTFGTKFTKQGDSKYTGFKKDLIDRLSHKGAYKHVGNNHAELVDIVIVVDMLLTGFDSQWINVLYLDDVIETNNLIQAISRTNRIFNNDEKPLGLVKFYRKPYSMERNLQEALSLYCQGDYEGVEVKDIQTNLALMNKTYSEIEKIFVANKIKNFECLPSSMEDRGMFRKKFTVLKRTLRAVMLQGFRWDNAYAKMLIFDKKTYEKLYMRYKDTLTTGGGGGGVSKPGYVVNNNLSTMEMDKIDVDYLEKWFKIVTMKDIVEQEKREKQMDALYELESNLGLLSELQQQYARKIIDDIRKGKFEPEAGKTFREYISEYQEKTIRANIHTISENTGLNEEDLFKLYVDTGNGYVDELRMKNLENTVDDNKLLEYYPNTSLLKAKIMLHAELKDYIENRKADSIN